MTRTAAETGRLGSATPAAIHGLPQFLRDVLAWRQRRLHRLLRRSDRARDNGDFKAAATLYRQALAFDPRRSDIRVQLGHMLKELARYDEAEASYRQALSQSPEGDTHLQLGHLLKLLGRRDEAIAAYTVAYRQLDENAAAAVELRALGAAVPGEEPHVLAEEHIAQGDRLRDCGRYADAARAYAQALELVPDRTDIRVQYGNMLKDSGQLSQAEAAYRGALNRLPDSAEIHLQLGHVFKTQGRRDEALAEYRRASEIQPSLDTAWKELALAGSLEGQQQQFELQLAHGGVEALIAVAEEIRRLQNSVLRIAESLPALSGQMAFPVSAYHRLRELYDIPEPPWTDGNLSFGVVLAADSIPFETLYNQITSISAQSYRQWRLAIVSSNAGQRQLVERAAASDHRIFWAEGVAGETSDIAERRIALGLTADWLVLPAPRARLHRHALAWYAAAFGQSQAAAFIADQEGTSGDDGGSTRLVPQLRQTLDYDTLLETNPFGETIAIERASYAAIADRLVAGSLAAARSSLLLELSAQGRVGHLPLPLVRSDAENRSGSSPAAAAQAHAAAVRGHVAASGLNDRISIASANGTGLLRVSWLPRRPREPVQVIVPTRDNGSDVREFVDSLRQTAAVPDQLRVLIVDNGSRQPETSRTLAALSARDWIRVVSMDEPFNWSRLNNRAAELSDAELLVFANDDMVMLGDGWDAQLKGLLERPEIGAVGARLLYPDDTVQHAGMLLGWPTGAVHDGRYEPASRPGPCSRWHVSRAVSAVTGAFLAVRREAFVAAGGFDEVGLPIAYGDVDFALRLRARGLKILWTPAITLRHYESKSRGLDHLDPEKQARNEAERRVIEARWGDALRGDPSINPFWHAATLPFRLISAPSEERLWRHIGLCAASNPWLPPAAQDVKTRF